MMKNKSSFRWFEAAAERLDPATNQGCIFQKQLWTQVQLLPIEFTGTSLVYKQLHRTLHLRP